MEDQQATIPTAPEVGDSKVGDLTQQLTDAQFEDLNKPSKNALKKAEKAKKIAEEKAEKAKNPKPKPAAGSSDSKKPSAPKAPKKKVEGAALIGIDVAKEDDFPGWYQQVLTKGDMLDYYDVSGCYILKVGTETRE